MSFPWKIFPTGFLTALKGFKHFFNFFLQYFQHSGGVKRKQWQQKELILKNEISKIGELLTTINIWYLVWTVNEDWENTKVNNRSVDKKPCQRIQYKASLCKAGRRRPQLNQESLWYLQFSPHVVNHTDLVLSSTSISLPANSRGCLIVRHQKMTENDIRKWKTDILNSFYLNENSYQKVDKQIHTLTLFAMASPNLALD